MVKLQTVKAARKAGLTCGACKREILVGEGYHTWAFRYGGTYYRCVYCRPEAWELESNGKRAALMHASAIMDRAAAESDQSTDEILEQIREAIALAEEARDGLQEGLDGWQGTNLEGSQRYGSWETGVQEIDDWIVLAEEWADTIERAVQEIDETINALEGPPEIEI